jgi:alkylhydroperoxidase family enzyme
LVKKTFVQPALLTASDLEPVREIVGDDALDYTLVVGSFHFINRIADLLDVPVEALPKPLRRFEVLRRLSVRIGSLLMAKMDLANRAYTVSYKEALENIRPLLERSMVSALDKELQPLQTRPKMIEALQLALEERDVRSSLDRETLVKIHRVVEEGLPANINEAEGFHDRPKDPVESFVFVGTRYAYRTTTDMIEALRQEGYDDIGILDLAIAVAEANQWARFCRLLNLNPKLYYLSPDIISLNPFNRSGGM